MKIIQLKSVYFISHNGITLTEDNPFIEATEDNLEKLSTLIKNGYLEVVDTSETKSECIEMISQPNDNDEISEGIVSEIKRYPTFTEDELKSKNKKELMQICKENDIEFKPTMKVSELEQLILSTL